MMNAFQRSLWERCEPILAARGIPFEGPHAVQGKAEMYFVARFSLDGRVVEVFLYLDEAGIMVDDQDWRIWERPDFDGDDQLVQSFGEYFGRFLSGGDAPA